MRPALALLPILPILCFALPAGAEAPLENPKIDAAAFVREVSEATALRAGRLLSPEEFARRAAPGDAVLLDARSRRLYDELHLKGASSLPYTEFTEASLAALVPDFDTPILIYCNNNFTGAEPEFATKLAPAALNLATFTALHTYGYTNVWELGELLDVRDPRLELVGTNAARYRGVGGTAAGEAGACAAASAGCSGMITQSTR